MILEASLELAINVLFPQMQGKKGMCKTPIRMATARKLSVRRIRRTNDATDIVTYLVAVLGA